MTVSQTHILTQLLRFSVIGLCCGYSQQNQKRTRSFARRNGCLTVRIFIRIDFGIEEEKQFTRMVRIDLFDSCSIETTRQSKLS